MSATKFPLGPRTASFWRAWAGSGVGWERATGSRLGRHVTLNKGFTPQGIATHLPQLVAGAYRLRSIR